MERASFCTAFGTLGEKIMERYVEQDDIWVIGKFYSNTRNDRTYKGINIREVINFKEKSSKRLDDDSYVGDDDLPF